ncbi:MAG: ubiquinol-cytochrome c reductase iron-sulfur subunit [Bryobacteraceae bacterium]|nr:ubiquinol-cytochrome c reductase iron-sulfur subunit [Bryobacteraceae bacterium]
MQAETKTPRRGLVRWLLGGGLTASVASFLYPVIRFMNPPEVSEAAVNEASVAKVQDFTLNSGKIVKFGSRPVLLIRAGESDWRAFSGTCTHLDCTVQYQTASHQIWCACHNGFYDLNGRVVSGPPPRPLEEYAVHIRGDEVIVTRGAG